MSRKKSNHLINDDLIEILLAPFFGLGAAGLLEVAKSIWFNASLPPHLHSLWLAAGVLIFLVLMLHHILSIRI